MENDAENKAFLMSNVDESVKILNILSLPGINVRNIPKESVALWTYREGDEERVELDDSKEVVVKDGRKFVKEIKQNLLAGYVVAFFTHEYSEIRFSKKEHGFGKTIIEAYGDFIRKQEAGEKD